MGRRDWWKRWVEEVEEKGVFDALKCIALVERGKGGPTDRITLGLLSAPTTKELSMKGECGHQGRFSHLHPALQKVLV